MNSLSSTKDSSCQFLNPWEDDWSHSLPNDLLREILKLLSPRELLSISITSKKMKQLASGTVRYKMALALGPSRFLKLYADWDQSKKCKEVEKSSIRYFNFRNRDVLTFKCHEKGFPENEFQVKFFVSKNDNLVNVYYSGFNRIIAKTQCTNKEKSHFDLVINQSLFDYFAKLAKGEKCGLLLKTNLNDFKIMLKQEN